ncbi:MAG: hypothetical protein NXH75_12375 [Halobacteriovoraceae bacterium]|nr:hypothetical protein [Halobacteriovoraceae bacterium]
MMTKTILLTLFIFISSAVNSKDVNVTRYGDRVFVTNFLIDIYGEVSRKIVEKEIFNKPSLFGGPCDPYSQTLKEDQKNRDSYKVLGGNERCIKDFFPEYTTSIILENSVLRSSALSSVCKKLSLCEKCMEFALKKIGLNSEAPRTVENSKKVYRQFYPFSESEFKSYEKIFIGNSKHSWPFTFELFCKTEEWQIP